MTPEEFKQIRAIIQMVGAFILAIVLTAGGCSVIQFQTCVHNGGKFAGTLCRID